MLAQRHTPLDAVFEIRVDVQTIIERVTGRFHCVSCNASYHKIFCQPKQEGVCDQCGGTDFAQRADDTLETVEARIASYEINTAPVLPYYEEKGILYKVDGGQDVDKVTQTLLEYLCQIQKQEILQVQ